MSLLQDALKQVRTWFNPPVKNFSGFDKIKDPFHGEVMLSQKDNAGLLRGDDGYLYSPLVSGYHRTKSTRVDVSTIGHVETNDDTAIQVWDSTPTDAEHVRLISAYHEGGAAHTLYIMRSDEEVIWSVSVAGSTYVDIGLTNVELPATIKAKWDGAIGTTTQFINFQKYVKVQESDVS